MKQSRAKSSSARTFCWPSIVKVEPVGEFALKDIRHPMVTYNVLEPLPIKPN
jgi:hypothetical protein